MIKALNIVIKVLTERNKWKVTRMYWLTTGLCQQNKNVLWPVLYKRLGTPAIEK